ncbi:hypothetical protein KAFR_0B02790 [Kazachstania africana CBS 2517]|uniref:Uncharacterized protein n=1 Tax=Kazachstania africana (strain ATCC 22294 / BCRC 22015 / CBS 2517 / CECT 1963 / NBRC 1671 / NRRL Y-8276) TaxID=1071382 RepID=H2AQC6_KAZAF|nr:hypothetical protein KAFR_0B02790 [Kazachstania africana CBS 2517]CCF56576.1 hypothetical protein KAFR_0B02790 [Kazachstania africana CBS 2517]
MKRTRRSTRGQTGSSTPIYDDEPAVEVKQDENALEWHSYLSEETLTQLNRVDLSILESTYDKIRQFSDVLTTWYYQYSIAWFYIVCNNSPKPMWKSIRFDEVLLLNNILKLQKDIKEDYDDEDDDEENEHDHLYEILRFQLLKSLTNSKSTDWNTSVNELLSNSGRDTFQGEFIKLDVSRQFEIIYHVIKQIESKNLIFRNYLNNNFDLFNFPFIKLDDSKQLIVLPTNGTVVEKKVIYPDPQDYMVPIKLSNCTIKTDELIHLDYSQEINSYLDELKISYKPISTTFNEYVKLCHECPGLNDFLEIKTINSIDSVKLQQQLVKEKSMKELLTRRKRSSRLVAKEEETKKRELEDTILTKLDNRDNFMKLRHRNVSRLSKKIKEVIWNQLWNNFEIDFKNFKLSNKNIDLFDLNDENLNAIDLKVLEKGEKFGNLIIKTQNLDPMETSKLAETNILELPTDICITQKEIDTFEELTNSKFDNYPDNKDWIFKCSCHLDLPPIVTNENEKDLDEMVLNHEIICCDLCYKWQHWNCQSDETKEILSFSNKQSVEYATVLMGTNSTVLLNTRRTLRNRNEDKEEKMQVNTNRPTDKRTRFGECSIFICNWCIKSLEEDLRNTKFKPELGAVRLKQKKQHDDRERRKKIKLEKKRLELSNSTTPAGSSTQLNTVMKTDSLNNMQTSVSPTPTIGINYPPFSVNTEPSPNPIAHVNTYSNITNQPAQNLTLNSMDTPVNVTAQVTHLPQQTEFMNAPSATNGNSDAVDSVTFLDFSQN